MSDTSLHVPSGPPVLSGKSRLAGVFGWPVSHSLSPRLHGFWLQQHGIDGAYVPLAVAPENFETAVRALPKLGFQGANVTVPHKEVALKLADEVDPAAQRIGAVNTFVVRDDGSILGRNTDGFGFMANLTETAPAWLPSRGPAVVLGAGGAARAVLVSLLDAGVPEIRLTNRTKSRAEDLAAEIDPTGTISVVAWEDRGEALKNVNLLVNTTALGMAHTAPLELDLKALPKEALVTDIVYVPLETDLLRAAAEHGNQTVDGLGMLLHQGRPGFEAWFGQDPEVTSALRDFVLAPAGT